MRFGLLMLCASALAFPAAAQSTNWKVDLGKWSRPGDRVVAGRTISITTPVGRTAPSIDIGIGSLDLEPSFRVGPADNAPVFLGRPFYDDPFELGLNGYFKDHPRVMLIGKYLYRHARRDEKRRLLDFEHANHLPDVSHGNRISLGISCSFPLKDCFSH